MFLLGVQGRLVETRNLPIILFCLLNTLVHPYLQLPRLEPSTSCEGNEAT